jgi:hypothetical protein
MFSGLSQKVYIIINILDLCIGVIQVSLKNIGDFLIQRPDLVSLRINIVVDQQFIELFDITKLDTDSQFLPDWPEIAEPPLEPYSGETWE